VLFGVVRGNPVVWCRDRDVERTEAEMGVEAGKGSSLSLSRFVSQGSSDAESELWWFYSD